MKILLIPLRLLDFTAPLKQCFGKTLVSRHPLPRFQNMCSIRSPANAAVTRTAANQQPSLTCVRQQLPQSQYWLILHKLLGINSLVNTVALKKSLSFTNSIKIQEHRPKILDSSHLGHVACRPFRCHFAGDFMLLKVSMIILLYLPPPCISSASQSQIHLLQLKSLLC